METLTKEQREWNKNIRDVDDEIGVSCSSKMKGVNEAVKCCNSGWKPTLTKDDPRNQNCQSCAVAYEMQRRGWDVVAKGRIPGENSTLDKLALDSTIAWRTIEGKRPKMTIIKKSGYYKDGEFTMPTVEDLASDLSNNIKSAGRYQVRWSWKKPSNSGHIISIEKFNDGELLFCDSQRKRKLKLKDFIKELDSLDLSSGFSFMRVDNLLIDEDIINSVVSKRL